MLCGYKCDSTCQSRGGCLSGITVVIIVVRAGTNVKEARWDAIYYV